jgi:hypothetical protein
MARNIHKYTAGGSGSSASVDEEKVVSEKKSFVLGGADYLWERLPFSKYEYERWSSAQRILLGYILWLVVLPTWPLVVLAVLWVNNQKFRWSAGFFLLLSVVLLWFWLVLRLIGVAR